MGSAILRGPNRGPRRGPVRGPNPSRWGVEGITRDGPGSWYQPVLAADYVAIHGAGGAPDLSYLMQDTSGALVPTVDALSVGNLTANASGHLYQQSITGWTRRFVGLDGLVASQSWRTTAATLDFTSGLSYAVYVEMAFTAPAATATMIIVQGTTDRINGVTATAKVRSLHNSVNSPALVNDHSGLTIVRQYLWYRNAATNVSGLVTSIEAVTATHDEASRSAGQIKGIGAVSGTAGEIRVGRMEIFKGANAEGKDWATYLQQRRAA